MLKQIITDRIRQEGPLSFKEFMQMALYYPEYGYYTSAQTEIGSKGDFYTSSHVHPVFGALIGKQIEEMWRALDMPDEFHIIEIGAGRGYLAVDMLEFLKATEFFDALRYAIVEINPYIRTKQEELLGAFREKITWVTSLNTIRGVTGCIVSNELIDAFPINVIYLNGGTPKEVYVTLTENNFTELFCDCSIEVINCLGEFAIKLPDGYRTEVNPGLKDWLQKASGVFEEGFIFTIDYGYPAWDYYNPVRNRGTLICYYQHQVAENPYNNIGMQDISAHVNFSAVKKWGERFGLRTLGYCPQGTFLVSLKIDTVLRERFRMDEGALTGLKKISSLISPDGLGESHKVLIQYKGARNPQLSGFMLRNRVDML